MADENRTTEEGNRIVDLEPSSPVDPRAQLPFEERQRRTRTLPNGTVVTDYAEPPLASEYSATKMPDDEYEALIEEVIAEFKAEDSDAARRLYGKWERNNLREMMAAEKAAKEAASEDAPEPDDDPWARLNGEA